jgi:hypothetical protein
VASVWQPASNKGTTRITSVLIDRILTPNTQ